MQHSVRRSTEAAELSPGFRRFPYPYRALLALSSDLDGTQCWTDYCELLRFLNTRQNTRFGAGLGLEFANSIYFANARNFGYENANERERHEIHAFVDSGHIDTLHSFGDQVVTRAAASEALTKLASLKRRMAVWVNHSHALTNFGNGFGDVPGHPAYHADLSIAYGIDYCWRGQVTSVVGQDVPMRALGAPVDFVPPSILKIKALAKQASKTIIGLTGKARYRMHGRNAVLADADLRDGQQVSEFLRCNPHWEGIGPGANANRFGDIFSQRLLQALVQRHGVMILYTHLGRRIPPRGTAESLRLRAALERIQDFHARGQVLVLSTVRLLDYLLLRNRLRVRREIAPGIESLYVDPVLEDRRVRRACERSGGAGLTFYVQSPGPHVVVLNGSRIEGIRVNGPDETGRCSVSLPLPRLDFPDLA